MKIALTSLTASQVFSSSFLNPLGRYNVFGAGGYCENDRLWRRMLALTPDRFQRNEDYAFDECHNVYVMPKRPFYLSILDNLHKKADYQKKEEGESSGES